MDNKEQMATALQAMHALPPPKMEDADQALAAKGKLKCACGQKAIDFGEVTKFKTGICDVINRTCLDCKKDLRQAEMCPIVCVGCKEVIAYLAPGDDGDGFIRQKGHVYHVEDCPNCNPERFEGKTAGSTLLEKKVFLQQKNT
jgi:hypothetical protein